MSLPIEGLGVSPVEGCSGTVRRSEGGLSAVDLMMAMLQRFDGFGQQGEATANSGVKFGDYFDCSHDHAVELVQFMRRDPELHGVF
jgi:hypothetical protein